MRGHPFRIVTALCMTVLLASAMAGGVAAHKGGNAFDLIRLAAATARFHSLGQADRAGYAQPPAPAPLHECISSFDDTGAMGFHYINGGLLDKELNPTKPEVLVYAPDRHGKLHLAALEFVIFQADWDPDHPGVMPSLFGEDFMATGFPNRYDIPAFYSLHVWLWQFNPSGLFAPFNPRVSCDGAAGSASAGSSTASLAAAARLAAAKGIQYDCGMKRAATA
jgi:hypothetical protein